ncbi:unnamed protein product [Phytophthora fragariaefolia]|uniref:Unnamed protein product n=1 Tax=Phytophthora fragariaefolia TaxID=1490495 RepID=A0A9W6YAF2_9STRA|nr:unnamed protein product [Phytophthora fragariaefolia]
MYKAQYRIFIATLNWISPLRFKDFRVPGSRAAPITQPPVPRSSLYSPIRPVPNRRDTLNDTAQARPDDTQPKTKTRAGPDNATQDRAGPDNATQDRVGPDNAMQTPRTRSLDNRAPPRARQENIRIKNKTIPVSKTIYSRFNSAATSISVSSSAVITTSATISAVVSLAVAGSAGTSTSVPSSVGAVSSTSTRPKVSTSGPVLVSPSSRPRRKSAALAANWSSFYLTELNVSDRVALGLGSSAESPSDSTSRGAGSSVKPLELLSGSSDTESDSVAASSAKLESSRGQTGDQAKTALHPKARAPSSATPALGGDDSSDDSDDNSLRNLASRIQTGRVATHGKAQSYLALGRCPPASSPSSDSAKARYAQWSGSVPRKRKEKKERRKHKYRLKRKHKSKDKHKCRKSELEDSAGSAGDGDRPRKSKRLASSDPAGDSCPSKKNRRDNLPPSFSRLSDQPAGTSLAVPSSSPLTTASVDVTPHPAFTRLQLCRWPPGYFADL